MQGGPPGGDTFEGKGPTFHDAAQKAADKAKDKHGPGTYKVVEIQVEVVNPIREYRVVLGND
jgi:hypothetical protein